MRLAVAYNGSGKVDTASQKGSPRHTDMRFVYDVPNQKTTRYEKGVANKGPQNDARFYSAKTPAFFQISRQEQVLDILRNVTTNPPDRVKEFSFKGSGGSYAKLFDGTEKPLSWDNILWINRTVLLP